MKINLLLISSFLLLGLGNVYAQDTLTILHLNDTHSTLAPLGPRNESLQGTQGGIARAASIIGLAKMSEPNVLTLHAGDVFMGDLFFNVYFGSAEFQILNSLGLDAMAVGNHEWDLTPSTLRGALQASFLPGDGFPLLSANLIFPDTFLPDTLKDYILPYTIKDMGNVKVGIFGLTTPETNVISLPSPYFIDTNIVEIAASMVDTLHAQNCDVIILLSHLGLFYDQLIAGYIPGINVIVGGHDHYLFEAPVEVTDPLGGTTWIVQANSNYMDIGKLKLLINGKNVSLLNYEIIPLDESVPEEPGVLNEINNLIAGIEEVYGPVYTQEVGHANAYFDEVADSLIYSGNHDTPIGNLVTDAFRAKTGTDVAIEAGGSTALPLYPGPLTAADVFRVVGYGFNQTDGLGYRLVTFDIYGADLWAALETVLATIELNDELFPQVSGMRYLYNPMKEPGSRLLSVTVGDKPLNPDSVYSVTGNEFLAAILTDYLEIPISNLTVYGDTTEFQALLGFITKSQILDPLVEGRIAAEVTDYAENENFSPAVFSLKQNYPNPFNPATTFEFRIPDLRSGLSAGYPGSSDFGHVSLKVYDILGKEVATIINEELAAGQYKYQWNAEELSSGVYFYQLRAGNFVDTKKLILMK